MIPLLLFRRVCLAAAVWAALFSSGWALEWEVIQVTSNTWDDNLDAVGDGRAVITRPGRGWIYDGSELEDLGGGNCPSEVLIDGIEMAWRDSCRGQIVYHDGTQIRSITTPGDSAALRGFKEGWLVWSNESGLYLRDVRASTSSLRLDAFGSSVQVGRQRVVWVGEDAKVFVYDGRSVSLLWEDGASHLSMDGRFAAWITPLGGNRYGVVWYDGRVPRVVVELEEYSFVPTWSFKVEGGAVSWIEIDDVFGGDDLIFRYDGNAVQEVPNGGFVRVGEIMMSGGLPAWTGINDDPYESWVMSFDGSGTRRVGEGWLADFRGGRLSLGSIGNGPGVNDGERTMRFPEKAYARLSGAGAFLVGWDGNDYEVYFARPNLTVSNVGDGGRIRLKWSHSPPSGSEWVYKVWRREEEKGEVAWLELSTRTAATGSIGEFLDGPDSSSAPARAVIYDYKVEALDASTDQHRAWIGIKKGVTDPFIMMIRGYGSDRPSYWNTYENMMNNLGFRELSEEYEVGPHMFIKPKNLWDTSKLEHNEQIYPGGNGRRIGQLDSNVTGEAVFRELSLWLDETRESTRKDSAGNALLDWVPEHFYVISHSLGGPTSRKLADLIDRERLIWKSSGSDPTSYIPFVKRNVMLSPVNLGSSLATILTDTEFWPLLWVREAASEKQKEWPASVFLRPENVAWFNQEVLPSTGTEYVLQGGHDWRGGVWSPTDYVSDRLGSWYASWRLRMREADSSAQDMRNDGAVTVRMQRGRLTDKVWQRIQAIRGAGIWGEREKWEFHPFSVREDPTRPFNHSAGMLQCDTALEDAWRGLGLSPAGAPLPPSEPCAGGTPDRLMGALQDTSAVDATAGTMLNAVPFVVREVRVPAGRRWVAGIAWDPAAPGALGLTLTSPQGTVLNGRSGALPAGVEYFQDSRGAAYVLESPAGGDWDVTVSALTALPVAGVDYAMVHFSNIEAALEPLPVGTPSPGEPVLLSVQVEGFSGSPTVRVEASYGGSPAQGLPLFDDGAHGDGTSGDGLYATSYTAPLSTGPVSLTYVADGLSPQGQSLRLTAMDGFNVVGRQTLLVSRALADRSPWGGDKYVRLEVDVEVSFTGSNPFVLTADLRDPSGSLVARGKAEVHGEPNSTVVATLVFKGEDIASSGLNGPYTVKNFFIFKRGGFDYAYNGTLTYETYPYRADQFPLPDRDEDGLPDVTETALGTDPSYRDTDRDGLRDWKEVSKDGDARTYTAGVDTNPRDPDTDDDGRLDGLDDFPLDRQEWSDRDGDGVGDNGDGYPDDPTRWENDNQAPEANAGPDRAVEAVAPYGADVTLNGSGSSDPEGDALSYDWSWSGGVVHGATPTVRLPLGTHLISLVVSDGNRLSAPDEVRVSVRDTVPPVISGGWASVGPIGYKISYAASDAVDPAPATSAMLEMPAATGWTVKYTTADRVRVVYAPLLRRVTVWGPDPQALWTSIRQNGGVSVANGETGRVLRSLLGRTTFRQLPGGGWLFTSPRRRSR